MLHTLTTPVRRSGLKNVCLGEKRRLALPRAALEEHRWDFIFRCVWHHLIQPVIGTIKGVSTQSNASLHNGMKGGQKKLTDCRILYLLNIAIFCFRARELLPRLVEKDMNWIDVEVVGINDMTFTRYETMVKLIIMITIKMAIINVIISVIIGQNGFWTSVICSGTCGCWILQSNGKLKLNAWLLWRVWW